jgi:nitric oxide reductase subunit B
VDAGDASHLRLGFAALGYLAIRVYEDHAPIPGRVVSEDGKVLFTRENVLGGQEAFLTYGLIQCGSVYGHGAYLGPDFTADYLHRQALMMQRLYGDGPAAQQRVPAELQANRFDPAADTLTWTVGQVEAFHWLVERYREEFLNRQFSGAGLRPPARQALFVHQQLASRTAGGQPLADHLRRGVPA